jgi:hypothetical protein
MVGMFHKRNVYGSHIPQALFNGTVGAAAVCSLCCAQVNVTLQLPFAQMPARVSEWRENESLIRSVVQNTRR